MATPIEFTYDDCEFETADGLILGGPYLTVELSTEDGETFVVESVRNQGFPQLGKPAGPAPVHVCDFIKQWAKDDAARGDQSVLRKCYADEMRFKQERRAEDHADFLRDQRRMLAAE